MFNSTVRNAVQCVFGTNAGVGHLYGEEKSENLCWLYDKYRVVARNCMPRNYRFTRSHKDY